MCSVLQKTSWWRHLMFKSSLSCFSCSAERCSSVLLWRSRTVLWSTSLHLTFYYHHQKEERMTEVKVHVCVCVWPCVSLWQSPRTCQCFWLVQTERRPVWWCPLPAHSKWSPRKLDTWWPELSDAGRLPEHTHTHGKSNYNNTPEDHQDQNQDHSGPGLNQDVDLLRIRKQKLSDKDIF